MCGGRSHARALDISEHYSEISGEGAGAAEIKSCWEAELRQRICNLVSVLGKRVGVQHGGGQRRTKKLRKSRCVVCAGALVALIEVRCGYTLHAAATRNTVLSPPNNRGRVRYLHCIRHVGGVGGRWRWRIYGSRPEADDREEINEIEIHRLKKYGK